METHIESQLLYPKSNTIDEVLPSERPLRTGLRFLGSVQAFLTYKFPTHTRLIPEKESDTLAPLPHHGPQMMALLHITNTSPLLSILSTSAHKDSIRDKLAVARRLIVCKNIGRNVFLLFGGESVIARLPEALRSPIVMRDWQSKRATIQLDIEKDVSSALREFRLDQDFLTAPLTPDKSSEISGIELLLYALVQHTQLFYALGYYYDREQ